MLDPNRMLKFLKVSNRIRLASVAYAGKNFGGGFKVLAGLVGGPGGGAPRTPENFRKFAKNFLKKIAKNALF